MVHLDRLHDPEPEPDRNPQPEPEPCTLTAALLPKLRTLDYKRVKAGERAAAEGAFRRTRAKVREGRGRHV